MPLVRRRLRRSRGDVAVPFNDIGRRHAPRRERILNDIGALLDSGHFIGGPALAAFESAFADWCGCAHAIGVANGTDALELALRSVGVSVGDEVVCVANAGGYATVACLLIGATPVYVDVDRATLQIDPDNLEEAMTPRTKAVIVTHLYGWMNDVAAVRALLQRLGRADVGIVEDCAQAHGAIRDGRRAGSLGDAAAFSFYPTKNLGALGDAGCVTCQDDARAAALRALRQYGWGTKYRVDRPHGRNSRLDPIQALALNASLPLVDDANRARRAVWSRFRDATPAGWRLIGADDESFVAHLCVMVAPDAQTRDRLAEALKANGIGFDIHYPILDCDQAGWQGLGRCVGPLAASRAAVSTIISLPCFPELSADEQDEVIAAVHRGT